MTLRAVFPNPDGLLLPGMFVRATVIEGVEPDRPPGAAAGRHARREGPADGAGAWTAQGVVELRALDGRRQTVGNQVAGDLGPGAPATG